MAVSGKLYRRLADSIATEIEAGKYKLGDRLPTERELAEQFGVSRATVRSALRELQQLGLVSRRCVGARGANDSCCSSARPRAAS